MAARRREAKRRNWPDHLNKNGAGYFYWRDPDTKKDHGLGRDQARAFAEARAANLAVEKRRGNISLAQKILEPAGKTLDAWSAEYEQIYIDTRKGTPATIKTVKSGIRAVRTAPFVGKHLREINTAEVSEFIKHATETRGAQMAGLVRKTLADMMREAETRGLIETGKNPVTVTRVPDFEVERSRLTLDQFLKIYEAALQDVPWAARSMELALLTAQRREDVASMLFSDVKDGFLFVTQKKTGAKLRIPVTVRVDVLGLSLEDVIKRCRDSVISKSMLHHVRRHGQQKPGDTLEANALTRAFARARTKSEITWEEGKTPPTFHELRSLAARLYSEQYSPDFAQAILGHKSASMTAMYRDVRGSEWVEVKLAG
ncbi:tyrosine-type recombinase/integrase [Paraburkholderia sp. USG1]|uniref:tyrosine-type recombinase/integrase n=1 Tax=Paraburkholderia sp. USG1 TaxID=2952268 RepID=UPI0028613833|nr:tyrosine-type recombinase/integrase [Paraburkholderia sp. USG1]MDR8395532.1 tyrosine-type recombinase/integrase [Paraburkholderia sp. USG1]